MAFDFGTDVKVQKTNKVQQTTPAQVTFNETMKGLGWAFKDEGTYTLWSCPHWNDYMFIRAYKDHYRLCVLCDSEHYEVKRQSYSTVKYDTKPFLAYLLKNV